MRLDLHVHTTASDGAWSPEAVVQGAVSGGLDVMAITDHDNTVAFHAACAAATELNLEVIPGIEVSSDYVGRDVHILGYFVDPESSALLAHAERAANRREERMQEMVQRLIARGIEVCFEDVEREAGPDRYAIGRPHLARALVTAGAATSVYDAFDRLIGDSHDAFVPTALLDPAGAVRLLLEAGGIPIWAHPPSDLIDPLLPGLVEAGLRGLEVYRPRNKQSDVMRFENICRSRGLLMSGGSDWHSPDSGSALGDFHVGADEIEGLLRAGGM